VAEYRATIDWRAAGDFAANHYSRAHRWTFDGGTAVPASASPQAVPAPYSDPAGVDPEEALVAAVSSCHMLWFLHLAREAGFAVASYRDEAVGRLGKGDGGRMAITRIALRPGIAFDGAAPDAAQLARLHEEAHHRCYIANSLRGEVVVEG
jgi:organic hydroperoxide reductase OsmC/OhrA